MGSKGSQTTTSTTAPNAQAGQLYSDLLARAQGVSNTPYNPYGGELTAPINAQQQMGIANINNMQPYYGTAQQYAQNAAQPITQQQIQQYMSPYTQYVVDATQRQFNNQNAQSQEALKANAIRQGALGGNRVGIASAELSNQQNLAQAPVIANLMNQGYTTGLNTALTEQQAMASGASNLAGVTNAGVSGAGAQIGAGTLQQQTQQANDLARYQQFMQQQAYPFQTAQWLAGLGTGVGSQMGGTNTTTAPAPNSLNSWLGLGAAGVGAVGQAGGWAALAGMMSRGGGVGVAGRAEGGGVASPDTMPESIDTLMAQQKQLLDGYRSAQMFPNGTPELDVPPGMQRSETPAGTFHHNPSQVDPSQIQQLSSQGRENELLDLGPIPKEQILARIQKGEPPVAIVERTPDGVEVRAAVGTHSTAPLQFAAMLKTKSPGNTLQVEDLRQALAGRASREGVPPQNDMGVAPGRDVGGPVSDPNAMGIAGIPYSGAQGWVPTANFGQKPFSVATPKQPDQSPLFDATKMGKDLGAMASSIKAGLSGAANKAGSSVDPLGLAPSDPFGSADSGTPIMARGGTVELGGPIGFAAGGDPEFNNRFDASYDPIGVVPSAKPDTFDDRFGKLPDPIDMTREGVDPRNLGRVLRGAEGLQNQRVVEAAPTLTPTSEPARPVAQNIPGLPPEITAGVSRPTRAPANPAMAFADEPAAPTKPAALEPTGVAGAPDGIGESQQGTLEPKGVAGIDISANSKLWPSLMTTGFGMMASRSPFLGVAAGEGGLHGMYAYGELNKAEVAQKLSQAQMQQKALSLSQEADKITETGRHNRASELIANSKGNIAPLPGYETPEGHPVVLDHRSGEIRDGVTGKRIESTAALKNLKNQWKPYPDKVTESGDPILINGQGEKQNASTGEILGPGSKILNAKDVPLEPDSLKIRAHQLSLGDLKSAFSGLGLGSAAARNKNAVTNEATRILVQEGGMSPKQAAEYLSKQMQAFNATGIGLSSEARTAGVREANLAIILRATEAAIPAALEASEAAWRTGWVPINQIIQKGQVIASNPELKAFGMANLQLAEHWARAMNPTGVMRESDRDLALHFLNTADSKDTYRVAVMQLKKQIEREKAAVQGFQKSHGVEAPLGRQDALTEERAKQELTAGVPKPANTTTPAAATPPAKPNLQQFLERARAANPGVGDAALTEFYNKKYGTP